MEDDQIQGLEVGTEQRNDLIIFLSSETLRSFFSSKILCYACIPCSFAHPHPGLSLQAWGRGSMQQRGSGPSTPGLGVHGEDRAFYVSSV